MDYWRDWIVLGSIAVLADDLAESAKQLHVAHTPSKDVDASRLAGAFSDRAKLIVDAFAIWTEALTTGASSYPGRLVGPNRREQPVPSDDAVGSEQQDDQDARRLRARLQACALSD